MRSTGQHAVAEHTLWKNSVREKNLAQEQDRARNNNTTEAAPF
jgi:hypothetical protein